MEAYKICDKLMPPVIEQSNYNMKRQNWKWDLFKKYQMGTTIWSPLESGILTGKYINGIPDDSRYKLNHDNSQIDIQPYLDNKKE